MASLSGVSSSNTLSSLMNSANMISGLASGLDTEGMIESLVKSYQAKINQLNQKVTKVEWKQDAYRSIISKMVSFANKYTSYSSSTNLLSRAFFSNAVTVSALGKYADAVTASGKTSSDVSLNAVHQLATAAKYRTSSNLSAGDGRSIEASKTMNLEEWTTLGTLNGSLTLTYGSQNVSISFDQVADVETINAIKARRAAEGDSTDPEDVLAELINRKLSEQTIAVGGKDVDASERIRVSVEDGKLSFSDKSTAGNRVFISGASGNVGTNLGISDALQYAESDADKPTSIKVPNRLTDYVNNKEYLSGQIMNISVDGVTKTIRLPEIYKKDGGTYLKDTDGNFVEYNAKNYTKILNDTVQAAFKGKVTVSNEADDYGEEDSPFLKLRFEVQDGSDLVINTDVGETLGIGRAATSYMNTSKTLGELLGEDAWNKLTPTGKTDKDGNDLYDFVINGVKVGSYSKNSKLSELMSDINNSDAGVKVSYSKTTKNFLFESKETGLDSKVELGGGLATAMFGEDFGSKKISELLGGSNVISREFRFTIGAGEDAITLSGEFDSNNFTMRELLDKLNDGVLKDKGYTADYSPEKGLFIKKGDEEVKVEFGDDALGKIVEASKPADRSSESLVNLFGKNVAGEHFEFTVNGELYTGDISSNGGKLSDLERKLNQIFKNQGDKYTAEYTAETGLVIRDKDGQKVDVDFGDNVLGAIAKEVEPKDRRDEQVTDILGVDALPQSKSFDFTVNGKAYTAKITSDDATMDDLLSSINDSLKATGYTASFSSITGDLVITDYQGREAATAYEKDSILGKVMTAYGDYFKANKELKEGESPVYTKGQDAIFDVTVNGESIRMVRSSNTVDIDGMSITMKEAFNSKTTTKTGEDGEEYEAYEVDNKSDSVTFKTNTNSDKIIDVIKDLVNDYNEMMAEIKSAYGTLPYQKSGGAFANYEPLTEEDMEGMSESAIERYEEKAKQGILFGDQTLSTLYNKLSQVFSFSSKADIDTLKDMGITVNYSTGGAAQTVTIDETKLRAMLDSDPDRVADLFTKTDGIMDRMKTQLDNYAKTTGEPKGILIQQAGSPLSSLSLMNNNWQKEIDNYTTQIERWQSKLESQVERYTSQFARLEQLIAQMNNQSSTLAGLMGGG